MVQRSRGSAAISIHAPLRERRKLFVTIGQLISISIHAPSRERRRCRLQKKVKHYQISILAPSRERHYAKAEKAKELLISILAPLRERRKSCYRRFCTHHFNPRSLAGATQTNSTDNYGITISIHAPLWERRQVLF